MRALVTVLAATLLAAVPAASQNAPGGAAQQGTQGAAQDIGGLSAIYTADVFQHEVIAMGKPVLDGGQGGDGAASDPAVQQALRYEPSPDVERRTRDQLLASLLESTDDPTVEAQIRQSVAGDHVWLQFHRVLTQAGLSTTNIADVTTAFYLIMWEVVNGPEATIDTAGVRAVHEDVTAALAAEPRLEDLTDAKKQEAASIMAYMATVAAASANQLRSTGNQAGLETLQDRVHQAVLGRGIDLAQLRLTDQGFATR